MYGKKDEAFTSVKHLANLGDIIAVMPAIKKYHEITGRRIKFCQLINTPAAYYPGATHPTTNDSGQTVCVNDKMFEMMKPLVESQNYIHSFEKYEGQHIDLDFDVIRGKTFVNLPHGMIQSWIFYAFPDLATDLSKPWLTLNKKTPRKIEAQAANKIVLNFTERYRNHLIDYFFLKNYMPDLVFAGTEREHFLFCNRWQLTIPRLEVNNFLEYAQALRSCRFLLGNQSFGWNICEAQKTPRILEVCQFAVNCMPFVGEHSYGFYHQIGAEYYFRKLYGETMNNKSTVSQVL
jgi:hypothetical protein